jgi:hypothetical protein
MDALDQIRDLYGKYQGAEGQAKSSSAARRDAGLALGKALYDLRAQAEVVSGGTTFDGTLRNLGIPHRTAYRWIKKYEISTGVRQPVMCVRKTIGLDPDTTLRKASIKMCRAGRSMREQLIYLGNSDLLKAQSYAEGCKDRDQLEALVHDLQSVKRILAHILPVVEAVLGATPTQDQEEKSWATYRNCTAEKSAEVTTVN